jgi:serine/threonine-protein kinase
MGAVWSATHLTLGHTVAIKFLHGNVASSAEPRARFEREAKLAARLGEASRHITRVTDHGISSEGTPFLVMELLRGEGLEKRLKRDRRLPMTLVARITAQLCRALSVAHGAGVVHRDLKPANVFLCEGESDVAGDIWVKLLDFGVAKATLENEENATTRAGALIGTPNYMSPEQIVGNPVDARTDLWAVAAIVYRMAVGKAPFGSGSLSELAMRIVSTEAPIPTTQAPDLPHELDLWVQKGLSKDPAKRFQSARELSDSLAMVAGISATGSTGSYSSGAAERLALQIGDSVGGLQHTVDGSAAAPSVPTPIAAEKPKSRAPIFAALAVLVLGGVGVGLWAAQRGSHDATPQAAVIDQGTAKPKDTATAATTPTVSATAATTPTAPTPTTATTASGDDTAASATATAKGTSPKKWIAPKGNKITTSTAAPTSTATPTAAPTATAAPTPTATGDKADELWKKKDEM